MHTPGHTPEHISILVDQAGRSDAHLHRRHPLRRRRRTPRSARRRADAPRSPASSTTRCSKSCSRSMTRSRCIPVTAPDRCAAPASARTRTRRSARSAASIRCCAHRVEAGVRRRRAGGSPRDATVLSAHEKDQSRRTDGARPGDGYRGAAAMVPGRPTTRALIVDLRAADAFAGVIRSPP